MLGVTIGDYNTYTDLGLYLKAYPVISPPEPRTLLVDIPGGNGSIDLSEALTGDIRYKTRQISMDFWCMADRVMWPTTYSGIMKKLHGRRLKITFDDDPYYYYIGRVAVGNWSAEKKYVSVSITAEVEPYKRSIESTTDEWEWDTFNFETGVIQTLVDLQVNGTLTVNVTGTEMAAPLNVTSSAAMQVKKGDGTYYPIKAGSNVVPRIVITEGDNSITFSGSGTVTIDYRGGML